MPISARVANNCSNEVASEVSQVTNDQTTRLTMITLLRLKLSAKKPAKGLAKPQTQGKTGGSNPNGASVMRIASTILARIVVMSIRSRKFNATSTHNKATNNQ